MCHCSHFAAEYRFSVGLALHVSGYPTHVPTPEMANAGRRFLIVIAAVSRKNAAFFSSFAALSYRFRPDIKKCVAARQNFGEMPS